MLLSDNPVPREGGIYHWETSFRISISQWSRVAVMLLPKTLVPKCQHFSAERADKKLLPDPNELQRCGEHRNA
jgi:hypothetical protein